MSLKKVISDADLPMKSPIASLSIKLWPPSQSIRSMIFERLVTSLSSPSIFTQKYGSLSREEAEQHALKIEKLAFSAADEHYEKVLDGDGSSALHLYASESSKLLIGVLKRGTQRKENMVTLASGAKNLPCSSVFDISRERRAFLEAVEAKEILKPLAEEGNNFTKIVFSNRSFGVDAARVAKSILVSLKDHLTEVDLSDFVAGRSEVEALQVMSIFSLALEGCILRSLNLSNNALGEKGVRAFGPLLKSQSDLEELYLMNDGISEDAAKAVSELLPSTKNMKILHFHNNMTGDEGAFAISELVKRSVALEDFRCSSTRIGSDGGVALAEALETCPKLTKLDLRDNMFGVLAGKAFAKALLKHVFLTEVYLSYLNLEDDGAIAIASALKASAPKLQILELAGNDISVISATALAELISAKQCLTKLNLSENELKDEGIIKVADTLKAGHLNLMEIDMSSNQLRGVGARKLAELAASKPEFTLLNINGNYISEEGIEEVKEILEASKKSNVLGPLDDNDPEGVETSEAESAEAEDELELKFEGLTVDDE